MHLIIKQNFHNTADVANVDGEKACTSIINEDVSGVSKWMETHDKEVM
jgi:hypothetical protein